MTGYRMTAEQRRALADRVARARLARDSQREAEQVKMTAVRAERSARKPRDRRPHLSVGGEECPKCFDIADPGLKRCEGCGEHLFLDPRTIRKLAA